MTQNGTITAHNRTWPLYERAAFSLRVNGQVNKDKLEDAEALQAELTRLLGPYGVEVKLEPITVLFISPEDQAEKNALDDAVIGHS